jgi:hypothetical protein
MDRGRSSQPIWIFAAALSIPLLCIICLGLSSKQKLSAVDILELCILALPNAVALGIPQLVCWRLWESKRISDFSFWGGMTAANIALIAFAILFSRSSDGDAMGWFFYYAVCIPLVPLSLLAGKTVGRLTSH